MKLETEKRDLQMQVNQAGFAVRNLQSELERTAALLEDRKREMTEALKHVNIIKISSLIFTIKKLNFPCRLKN